MRTQRIEYIRKNDRWSKEQNKYRSKGEKRGVLYASIDPINPNAVIVGFSLCNKLDRFDYIKGNREPGFGMDLAAERAIKWANHTDFFVQNSFNEMEIEDSFNGDIELTMKENPDTKRVVEVPPSIIGRLEIFIERCKKYYKDKKFPEWVEKVAVGEEIFCLERAIGGTDINE